MSQRAPRLKLPAFIPYAVGQVVSGLVGDNTYVVGDDQLSDHYRELASQLARLTTALLSQNPRRSVNATRQDTRHVHVPVGTRRAGSLPHCKLRIFGNSRIQRPSTTAKQLSDGTPDGSHSDLRGGPGYAGLDTQQADSSAPDVLPSNLVATLERAVSDLKEAPETAPTIAPAKAKTEPEAEAYYVSLDQMAAIVNRRKRTLERRKTRSNNPLPPPDVEGGGGRQDEWIWSKIRPWLENEFGKKLPKTFPSDAANRH